MGYNDVSLCAENEGGQSKHSVLKKTSQRNGLQVALAFSRGEQAAVGHFGAGSAVLCNGMASATKP
jgi:hypothetical protein